MEMLESARSLRNSAVGPASSQTFR